MESVRGDLKRALSSALNDPTSGWMFKGEDPKAKAVTLAIENLIDAKINYALKKLGIEIPND